MARPSTIPVGLRLPPALLDRLNERAAEMGTNRSALIVVACNEYLNGSTAVAPSPVSAPSTSVVDQPARDALVALKARVEALEKATAEVQAKAVMIEQMRQEQEALAQQAEAKDDFADQFARG